MAEKNNSLTAGPRAASPSSTQPDTPGPDPSVCVQLQSWLSDSTGGHTWKEHPALGPQFGGVSFTAKFISVQVSASWAAPL